MYKSLFWIGFTILFLFMLYILSMHIFLRQYGVYFINLFIAMGVLIGYLILYFRSKRDIDYEITLGIITSLNSIILFGGGEFCFAGFFASFNIDDQCFWLSSFLGDTIYAIPLIAIAIAFISVYFNHILTEQTQCLT